VAIRHAHRTGQRPGPPVRDLTEVGDDLVATPVHFGEPILKRGLGTWQFGRQLVSFTSPAQLPDAIDKFVKAYNQKAAPFEWTKAVVHPTAPKRKYADLCN